MTLTLDTRIDTATLLAYTTQEFVSDLAVLINRLAVLNERDGRSGDSGYGHKAENIVSWYEQGPDEQWHSGGLLNRSRGDLILRFMYEAQFVERVGIRGLGVFYRTVND